MRNINWMRALRRLAIQGGLAPLAISSSFATSSSALTSTAVIAAISLSALQGCSPKSHPAHTPPLDKQRELDKESASVPELGQWLLSELFEVNGSAANAIELRQALLKKSGVEQDMWATLALGWDYYLHGEPKKAAEYFYHSVIASSKSDDSRAAFVGWTAVKRLAEVHGYSPKLIENHLKELRAVLDAPGKLGWRARSELSAIWEAQYRKSSDTDVSAEITASAGCLRNVSIAGPFGTNSVYSSYISHPAEAPGPWPQIWPKEKYASVPATQLAIESEGCWIYPKSLEGDGTFYAEAWFELEEAQSVLLFVDGSTALWVDGYLVNEWDPTRFGEYLRLATRVKLEPGLHRIRGRIAQASTEVIVLNEDGTPAKVRSRKADGALMSHFRPVAKRDVDLLSQLVIDGKVHAPVDRLTRLLSAKLALDVGHAELAHILFEPFIEDLIHASGPALELGAEIVHEDGLFDETTTGELKREMYATAAQRDARLWRSQLSIIVDSAESHGWLDEVKSLEKLARLFPKTVDVQETLAQVYLSLGWDPEYRRHVKSLETDFPNEDSIIRWAIEAYDNEGDFKKVDELRERLMKNHPENDLLIEKALDEENYAEAIRLLEQRLSKRPDDRATKRYIKNIERRAGLSKDTRESLLKAVKEDPKDASARIKLADYDFSRGDKNALRTALTQALEAGSDAQALATAIDLLDGLTELAPFRLDGLQVIADYNASGVQSPGTAARILDYSAIWVNRNGSSRMLTHEILKIQSEEAIRQFAEQEPPRGLSLQARVIKADGRTLEPERVAGKPTLTYPHLEIGDCIETQYIETVGGGGDTSAYRSPGWMFRELNVSYARSEYVVVVPADRKIIVERRNGAPAAKISELPGIKIYNFRMDNTEPLAAEPSMPSRLEVVPTIQLGWGFDLKEFLYRQNEYSWGYEPVDPRMRRIASSILKEKKLEKGTQSEKARALYNWVHDTIEEGEENDGRRSIIGKSGSFSAAFNTLCRAADIELHYVLAKNSMQPAPLSMLGEIAPYDGSLLRVGGAHGDFVSFGGKYLPYGYIDPTYENQEAYVLGLTTGAQKITVGTSASPNFNRIFGELRLDEEGNAKGTVGIEIGGQLAAGYNEGWLTIPENQQRDALESAIFGHIFSGAHVESFEVFNIGSRTASLRFEVKVSISHWARKQGNELLIEAPNAFDAEIVGLARRSTILIRDYSPREEVDLKIVLPKGRVLKNLPEAHHMNDLGSKVRLADEYKDGILHIDRLFEQKGSRINPADYANYQKQIRETARLSSRPYRLGRK